LILPENEHILLLGARTGYMKGFGGKDVPLFERYFLGGPDDLKGFDYREVGPKSNDKYREPLGGKTFAFGTAEYSVKVAKIVRLAGFLDGGFLNPQALDWRLSDYNADCGLGLRIFILNAPLRIDFAFPLKSDLYNNRRFKFSYSFGLSF
jgi:outer membrane protein insertion porin family